MPSDKRDDKSYMDGIPVKISEKYKRKPVIRLPNNCNQCTPGPAFYDKYDFRLENSMLSRMEEWKKRKDEECQILDERAKLFKTFEEQEVAINEEVEVNETIKKNDERIVMNGASCVQANILLPMNVSSANQQISRPMHSNFNVSDFETDNSSPFDNMELKTINDMEVLASVLSTNSDNQAAVTGKNQMSPPPPINNNFIPNENSVIWNNWNGHMFSSPQYFEPAAHFSNIYPNTSYNLHSHPSQMLWHDGGHTLVHNSSPHTVKPNYINYSANKPENAYCDTGIPPPKNNSKSVPDLVLELENELKEKQLWNEQRRKTKTPPPRSTGTSLGLEDWKPWPDLESPRHIGPDAVETLDVPFQSLAKSISEMGFPIERVVRTIRQFQNDDKKVIEFLLQIQRFEEKKFKVDAIEKALHANNYDEDETLKHLEATAVLLDLGFDPEKIKNILLDCKNDRDAALDRLIS